MLLPATLWITALLWLLPVVRRRADQHLTAVDQALGVLEAHGRSGAADWRPVPMPLLDQRLDRLLERAWRAGQPLVPGLAAFRQVVRSGTDLARATTALWRLFLFRVGLALLLVTAIRATMRPTGGGAVDAATAATEAAVTAAHASDLARMPALRLFGGDSTDTLAIVLAVALLSTSTLLLSLQMPRCWLGLRALTPAAYQWLAAYILDDYSGGSTASNADPPPVAFPPAAQLQTLVIREWRTGVSLAAEKKQLLRSWAEGELEGSQQALRRLGDVLPLFELFGIGLPMLLLLLMPLTHLLTDQAQQ